MYKSAAKVSLYVWFPIDSQNNMVDNSRYHMVYYSPNINKTVFIRAIRQVEHVASTGRQCKKLRFKFEYLQGRNNLEDLDADVTTTHLRHASPQFQAVFPEPLPNSGWFPACKWRLACRRCVIVTVREPMGVGAAVVRADWLALGSMWGRPHN
jgi:hypothetical protein